MTRPATASRLLLTAALPLTAGLATAVSAAPGDVSWELIRPTNTGVPGDFTQAIFIDDDDSPWIAGYIPFWEEGGVGHFDGTNWRVLGNVDCPSIASPRFNDIVKTDDGTMWIGSDEGLLRFEPTAFGPDEPWCVTRYHAGNTPLRGNQIVNIDIAPDGTLWLATQEVGGGPGGLAHYDPASDSWQFWDTTNGLPWWAGWDDVDYVAVQEDAGGGYTVWFGSGTMGLTSYKDGLFIWYGSATPPDITPLPTGVFGKDPVADDGRMLIATDQGIAFRDQGGGYELIGGYPAGLTSEVAILEPISGGRVLLGTFYADVFLWDDGWEYLGNWGSGSHTYTLTEDSTGAFWAGGIGGAAKYEDGSWQRYRVTNTGMLDFFSSDISLAPNGDVAMTANAAPGTGGFDILHPNGTWTNANAATDGLGLPWPYPTDNTSAVEFRHNNNLLFAPTNNGLREYDGDGYRDLVTTTYDFEHIAVAGNGRGWAATDRAVVYTENEDGVWEIRQGAAQGVPSGSIAGITPDPQNPDMVYIGAGFGITHTDGQTHTTIPREAFGLTLDTTGHHITDFDVAPDGAIWAGSGLGLHRYDPATGDLTTWDLNNSPIPSDDLHDVEIAPDGSVWISMFDQISPYPGGLAQLKDGVWRIWSQPTSPLPHNQVWDLASRALENGGYQIWVATASEAITVITVEGDGPAGCNAADVIAPFDVLDLADVQAFVAAFGSQDPLGDLDGSGVFDLADVQAFITAFNAGCP